VTRFPLRDAAGAIYAVGGIATDITERRRLETEILQISEREQRRIAQDLHDGLGQQLAGVWCLSDVLRKNLETQDSSEAAAAEKIARLLSTALEQTRNLAKGLHPVAPESDGLMSALENLAGNAADLFEVSSQFKCREPVPVEDNSIATHLYRIAQEAVTNSIKHGRARNIEIGLSSNSEQIILSVCDDGIGFRRPAGQAEGLGLRTMSYRARLIGGTLLVQRQTEGGTKVVCTIENTRGPRPRTNHEGQNHAGETQESIHC
jgi:signal transduction histidine kinase